ncbi:exodeoxyribonuclease VII small subunit [Desulforudis sp. 1088]|uniref:exodeoxyribonuclease VII small subunit n=1 Tax=unclassified Candidatus Desulforudis TaxID=2635950 RepID=UPI00347E71A5
MGNLSFEEAIMRLEEIVHRLEDGRLPLEEALDLYAEGVTLARHCRSILDSAEQRVRFLSGSAIETGDEEQ